MKKRTKVIKNNVNPVWNEVCAFLHPPSSLCCHGLCRDKSGARAGGGFLSGIVKEGRYGGPVCQLNPPGAGNLGGRVVAWHARQTEVGVAWGGVGVYLCSLQLCQPGRGWLGALWPVLSPLHRPFSLPNAHLWLLLALGLNQLPS